MIFQKQSAGSLFNKSIEHYADIFGSTIIIRELKVYDTCESNITHYNL